MRHCCTTSSSNITRSALLLCADCLSLQVPEGHGRQLDGSGAPSWRMLFTYFTPMDFTSCICFWLLIALLPYFLVVVVVVVAVALLLEDSPLLKDPSPHVSMPCLWIVAPSNATDASLQHGRNTWGCQLKRHLFNASCQGKSDYPPRCKRMSVAVFLHPVH